MPLNELREFLERCSNMLSDYASDADIEVSISGTFLNVEFENETLTIEFQEE